MNKRLIYFDWNALTILKNPKTEVATILLDFLVSSKDKIIVPYSSTHLEDLNKDYEKNKSFIDEDLRFLSAISNNINIAKYFGSNETILEHRDVLDFFNEIVEEKSKSNSIIETFEESINEDGISLKTIFEKIDISSILKSIPLEQEHLLAEFNNSKSTGTFWSLIEDLSTINDKINKDPNYYNELRKKYSETLKLDPNISNWKENTFSRLDKYFEKTILGKSFSVMLEENVRRYHKDPIFFDYYLAAYDMLGFNGFRPDKLTEKNTFNNMIRDSFHSYYGSRCYCFITGDKVSYFRSKALFDAFEIPTKLIKTFDIDNPDDFRKELQNLVMEVRSDNT